MSDNSLDQNPEKLLEIQIERFKNLTIPIAWYWVNKIMEDTINLQREGKEVGLVFFERDAHILYRLAQHYLKINPSVKVKISNVFVSNDTYTYYFRDSVEYLSQQIPNDCTDLILIDTGKSGKIFDLVKYAKQSATIHPRLIMYDRTTHGLAPHISRSKWLVDETFFRIMSSFEHKLIPTISGTSTYYPKAVSRYEKIGDRLQPVCEPITSKGNLEFLQAHTQAFEEAIEGDLSLLTEDKIMQLIEESASASNKS